MCTTADARLFVRADFNSFIEGKLPDVHKTGVTPAGHMNYGGAFGYGGYSDSGYLSLFEYLPNQTHFAFRGGQNRRTQSAAWAISQLSGSHIHFLFVPNTVQQQGLDESNVRSIPNTQGNPTLLNTDRCNPPARITEDGDVLERAVRDINEYLYLGGWERGMKVITERKIGSSLLSQMFRGVSLEDIKQYCDEHWPCPGPGNDYPDGPGPSSGGFCVS